jgi:hypothetical protein
MAVTHKETGLTPVEMLEHLILTRNLISGNIACSFDSWVQKKTRRPFKAARARELRTATIVANRRTGRVRSIAKDNPKLKPTDVVIGEVDVIIYDRHGLDVFPNMALDVDVILTAADGTSGRWSSTMMLVNSDISRMLFSGSYMSEADMDLSNHSVISNCVDQAAQDWLKNRSK